VLAMVILNNSNMKPIYTKSTVILVALLVGVAQLSLARLIEHHHLHHHHDLQDDTHNDGTQTDDHLTDTQRRPLLIDPQRKPLLVDPQRKPLLLDPQRKPLLPDPHRKPYLADSSSDNQDLDSFTTTKPLASVVVHRNKRRDLGMLALKAILLGPLIGLTIKAALIRGLIWAVLAYGLHLVFPALLSSLGLGTGLVGFARQLKPNYNQMLVSYFVNLIQTLPASMGGISGQYRQLIVPVVESIRAIPEGHCRYRAVCETASQLIRNSRSMSTSLQRISATIYMNFGNDYSRAWLDGIVQSDCAEKYAQCTTSPFSMVAARLAQTIGASPWAANSAERIQTVQ
jgi:hypothetical protein